MTFTAITPDELDWITRPHEAGEPARHVAELSTRPASPTCAGISGATSRAPAAVGTDTLRRRRRSS